MSSCRVRIWYGGWALWSLVPPLLWCRYTLAEALSLLLPGRVLERLSQGTIDKLLDAGTEGGAWEMMVWWGLWKLWGVIDGMISPHLPHIFPGHSSLSEGCGCMAGLSEEFGVLAVLAPCLCWSVKRTVRAYFDVYVFNEVG